MKLSSSAFLHGEKIPEKYSCQGEDINPPLKIEDIPEKTKSLALIMDDPDVPKWVREDSMWVHWVVYNIDPAISEIKEGIESLGVVGKNTSDEMRYMGPCPPDREHRYFFKLYALDVRLSLVPSATKEQLINAMQGHVLDESELMGRYEKS